jgi:hypothetical protein
MIADQGATGTDVESNGGTGTVDNELKAISTIVDALRPLSEKERQRVLEYVAGRFGIPLLEETASLPHSYPGTTAPVPQQVPLRISDIRSLKEAKAPKSANEMAALVAYYVSELAPADQRSKQINKGDIERYFKTAGFRLPADAAFTLVNAKNAGYLDTAGAGQYTLNPVGYNLVVHRMGADRDDQKRAGTAKKSSRRASKKATARRKK